MTDASAVPGGPPCLIAIAFEDPLLAQEALLAAVRLQRRDRLDLEDAAIVTKGADGKVRIQQTRDLSSPQGALAGSWWGILAGLFTPGGPIVGGMLGAAIGGLWAKLRDIGISDDEMRELGDRLPVGEAALFLLVNSAHRYHAMLELRRFPGRLFHSTLSEQDAEEVAQALGAGVITL